MNHNEKEKYCRPQVVSLAEEDLKELTGVAETQYQAVFSNCLDSATPQNSVQDEFTFTTFAGAVIDITVDVPDGTVCPSGTGDCPLNPEVAICPGTTSPNPMNPLCTFDLNSMTCSDPALGAICCRITGYTAPTTGGYVVAVNPETLWVDPAATGCYVLTITSSYPLSNQTQTVDDGADSFFK
jgi:hypothetical protein